MRVLIAHGYALRPGGAPIGARSLAAGLAADHEVHLVTRAGVCDDPLLNGIRVHTYTNAGKGIAGLSRLLKRIRPDVVVLFGYFDVFNCFLARAARKAGATVVLHPLAQVWPAILRESLFTQGCDVRSLEKKQANVDSLGKRLYSRVSPLAKRVYIRTTGAMMVRNLHFVAALSSEERRQFQSLYERPDDGFTELRWGIDSYPDTRDRPRHYFRDELGYRDGRANLIVWARLDWHYKGLDRAINAVAHARRNGTPPFRVFLCGPDYRGGGVKAAARIEELGLSDDCRVLFPGDYEPGDLTPLRDADATVLLPRWDGAPRALRESLALGTPVVVSPATNFIDQVEEYRCGVTVSDADDPAAVAAAFAKMCDPTLRAGYEEGARRYAAEMDWTSMARRFMERLAEANAGAASRATCRPGEETDPKWAKDPAV